MPVVRLVVPSVVSRQSSVASRQSSVVSRQSSVRCQVSVRSIELKALDYGIGLHGPIMGLLMPEVNRGMRTALGIPEDYELVHFGIMAIRRRR